MRKILYAVIALFAGLNIALANSYYNASGAPATGAALVSSTIRNEFSSIATGFNLLPTLSGHGNEVTVINAGGTALTSVAGTAIPGLTIGTNVQAWDADLDAIAALSSTAGMLARTGAGAFAVRTLTGTANEITVANGDGSGTPTLSLPATLTLTSKTVTVATQSAGDNSTKAASTAYVDAAISGGIPAGAMFDFAGTVAPSGYLGCDGSVVSQATYATLYAAIGTTWNTGGEGGGNFRLPNFQRKVAVGSGGSGTATLGNSVGNTGGEETHTLITAELASHTHTGPSHTHTGPSHTHTGTTASGGSAPTLPTANMPAGGANTVVTDSVSGALAAGTTSVSPTQLTITGGGAHTHTFTTDAGGTGATGAGGTGATGSAGSGTAHNVMQPSAVVLKIIKY